MGPSDGHVVSTLSDNENVAARHQLIAA